MDVKTTTIRLSLTLRQFVEEQAKKQHRTFSNYIEKVLIDEMERMKKNKGRNNENANIRLENEDAASQNKV
jgi:predicted DNA-binding protein